MKRIVLGAALGLISACGLANGLQGSNGEPGGAPSLTSLSWHGPVQIDQDVAPGADAPSLAWGQDAAWVSFYAFDSASNTASTWVTRRPRGGSFARPVQLPNAPGWDGGAAYPQIAIGGAGNAVVAVDEWDLNAQHDVDNTSVWAARVDPSLTVLQADLVRIDGNAAASLSQVAVDEAGNAFAVFSSPPDTFINGQPLGSTWSSYDISLSDNGIGSELEIAAGAADNTLAIYSVSANDSSNDYLWYAITAGASSQGTRLGGPKYLTTGNSVSPALAVRGEQALVVVADGNGALHTYAVSSGVWGAEQIIPDAKASFYVDPEVAVNSKGEAVLIWRDYDPGNTDAYAGTVQASYWDGGSWSPQQQISNAGVNPHAWWAKVDLNERGEAAAAWADFEPTGTYNRIYASILETNSGAPVWTAPVAIDQASPDAGLANQPQNVRYVGVSLERDGGVAQVIYMQHESDSNVTPRTWANWLEAP